VCNTLVSNFLGQTYE